MSSPAYEMAQYLESLGIGVFAGSSGWSISVDRAPVSPDNAITLQDQAGGEPDTDELDIRRPNLLIQVRSDDYRQGYAKQQEIMTALITPAPFTYNGIYYVGLRALSDVLSLGQDESNRFVTQCTYQVEKQV